MSRRHFNHLIPAFSIDKSKAVIKVESYTETCGGGAIYLLGRNSGKWEILDQLQMWEND